MKKKKIFKIIAVTLCAAVAAAPLVGAGVYYARGILGKGETPKEFRESIRNDASLANDAEIRIMSANLLVGYKSWGGWEVKPRAKMFCEVLDTYKPDVIGLQEVCDGWFAALRNMPDGYKIITPLATGVFVNMTALAYNSNTLELIENGKIVFNEGNNPRLRRVVWGLFEVKTTGKRFVATSTHFDLMSSDGDSEKKSIMQSEADKFIKLSNELREKYSVPVISTGDYNAMERTPETRPVDAPEIYEYLADTFTDCKFAAENRKCGNAWALEQPVYDHIFLNGEAKVKNYELLSGDYLSTMSDHYPIYADIEL